jgi:hypothetical protein
MAIVIISIIPLVVWISHCCNRVDSVVLDLQLLKAVLDGTGKADNRIRELMKFIRRDKVLHRILSYHLHIISNAYVFGRICDIVTTIMGIPIPSD